MKTDHKTKATKRKYGKPGLTRIKIDNQISMVMMSGDPPDDPNKYYPLNPFK